MQSLIKWYLIEELNSEKGSKGWYLEFQLNKFTKKQLHQMLLDTSEIIYGMKTVMTGGRLVMDSRHKKSRMVEQLIMCVEYLAETQYGATDPNFATAKAGQNTKYL